MLLNIGRRSPRPSGPLPGASERTQIAVLTGEGGATAGNGHDPDAAAHGAHVNVPPMFPPMAPPKDRQAEPRKEAGVGIGLADDLRSIRTALVNAYLATSP